MDTSEAAGPRDGRIGTASRERGAPASSVATRGALAVALLAPLVLVTGMTLAQLHQPDPYDPVAQTVSALAARGATDRWIMTWTLVIVGASYVLVAAAMRPVPISSRVLLGLGGAMAVSAGLAPQPAGGSSATHMVCATLAWAAFATWPLPAMSTVGPTPAARRAAIGVTVAMAGLLGWFCAQLWSDGTWLGVAERVLLVAQTVWPVRVACWARRASPGTSSAVARTPG